jgi:hypothetical protein
LRNFIHALTVDPASSSKVWAASDGGLQASHDGGGTWSPVLSASVYSLLFDSRHPGTIYAGEAWEDLGLLSLRHGFRGSDQPRQHAT